MSFFLLMKESANVRNIKHPIWENLYKTISIIDISEFSELQKKLWQELLLWVKKRYTDFENVISPIINQSRKNIADKYSNYNLYKFESVTRKLIKHIAKEEPYIVINNGIIYEVNEYRNMTKYDILSTIKWLYRILLENHSHYKKLKFLQYFYDIIDVKLKDSTPVREKFCGFYTCEFCWRFIPDTGKNLHRCDIHNPINNNSRYQRDSKFVKLYSKKNGQNFLHYLTFKIVGKLHKIFKYDKTTDQYFLPDVSKVGSEDAKKFCYRFKKHQIKINW